MNKIALVTGSSRGIGRHIAIKLAQNNYSVIVTGRQASDVEQTAQEIVSTGGKVFSIVADLSNEQGLEQVRQLLIQNNLKLSLLVCNIGKGGAVNENKIDLNEWKRVFDINFFSTVLAFNTFYDDLVHSKGHVVCISSIAGVEKMFLPATYGVAKAAVISFVQQMMRPLAEQGVRINCISPGMVWVENGSWHKKMQTKPEWVNSLLQSEVAFKKFVDVDDIASAVLYLEQNKSMTGQNLVIDAGHTRQS